MSRKQDQAKVKVKTIFEEGTSGNYEGKVC